MAETEGFELQLNDIFSAIHRVQPRDSADFEDSPTALNVRKANQSFSIRSHSTWEMIIRPSIDDRVVRSRVPTYRETSTRRKLRKTCEFEDAVEEPVVREVRPGQFAACQSRSTRFGAGTAGSARVAQPPCRLRELILCSAAKRRQYLRQYVRWLWPYRFALGVVFLLALASAALDMVWPLAIKKIIDIKV